MKIHPGFRKLFNTVIKFKNIINLFILNKNIIYLNAQTHDLLLQSCVLTN
jgi:hypothetical protein